MRFAPLLIAVCASVLGACAEETADRAPLVVQSPVQTAPVAVVAEEAPALEAPETPVARAPTRLRRGEGSTRTGVALSPKTEPTLQGVSTEFPWGNGDDGAWMGTGVKDPEPLQKISDEEMMKRATDIADTGADRQHALVSIGRRHLPGTIEVFRQSIEASQDRAIREMALSGLMEHGGTEALPLMWEVLRKDASPMLRGMAIWAVALYGPNEARKAIDHGLTDDQPSVRGMAILAVWALKDRPEEALPLLKAAIESDEQLVFQEGFYNLSRMPYPEAADILEEAVRINKDEKKVHRAVFAYRAWRRNYPDLKQ